MATIFDKTNDDREIAAGLAPPRKPPLPAAAASAPPKPPVDFIKGYTPEERARQYQQLQDMLLKTGRL